MLSEPLRDYRVGVKPHVPARSEDIATWPTGRLLSSAARLVEHDWNLHLARWQLNHASLGVLHVLLAQPMSQRELAAAVQVEDQTMSRTLEKLERCGYIERARDDVDRRRVRVALTPLGRRTCLEAGDVQLAEGFFASVEDVEALRASLIAVIRSRSQYRWGPDARLRAHPPADPSQTQHGEDLDVGRT
jgi:DNA-binding MarR family transcriptional regulator